MGLVISIWFALAFSPFQALSQLACSLVGERPVSQPAHPPIRFALRGVAGIRQTVREVARTRHALKCFHTKMENARSKKSRYGKTPCAIELDAEK